MRIKDRDHWYPKFSHQHDQDQKLKSKPTPTQQSLNELLRRHTHAMTVVTETIAINEHSVKHHQDLSDFDFPSRPPSHDLNMFVRHLNQYD